MNNIQSTDQWKLDRIGKITASRFADVMVKPKDKTRLISKGAESYLYEKIDELLTGESRELNNPALDFGKENESIAIEHYELIKMRKVELVGFIPYTGPNEKFRKWVGCSPDGLVGKDGGVEAKNPENGANFVDYWDNNFIPKDYYAQVQGNLWVTNRKWWDFLVFNSRIKDFNKRMFVMRVERDEKFIAQLEEALTNFITEYENKLIKLRIEL